VAGAPRILYAQGRSVLAWFLAEAVLKVRSVLALLASVGIAALGVDGCSISIETSVGTGGQGTSSAVVSSGGDATGTSVATGSGGGSDADAGVGGGAGLAAACTSDATCGFGLTCLTDTIDDPVFGGGPAGGFCTAACSGDADCASLGGVCLQIDPGQSGRCTLPCTIGPAINSVASLFDPLDPTKCLGREDLRCGKATGDIGKCLPTCGEDAQCHDGRSCDPRLAVCVSKPSTGDAIGSTCDPMATDTSCAGLCVGFNSGVAMCSSRCVLGGEKLQTSDCGGPAHGICAFRPAANGPGDAGYCSPSCGAQSDCQTPNFWCFDIAGVSEQTHRGYCFAAASCPNGQADCVAANDANFTCTATPYGAFCLDPAFPVGP
jgi:hypothetical protein